MSQPVPAYRSRSAPARQASPTAVAYSTGANAGGGAMAPCPLSLDQLLERAREYLAFWIQALPEPWPGCVLLFSVAHSEHPATVFSIKAHTFQSAWREGSIRVRQWAWARRLDTALLRIDWAQDIAEYSAGQRLNRRSIEQLLRKNGALADLGFEHTALLQHALASPVTEQADWVQQLIAGQAASAPFLVLQMRGIYLDNHAASLCSFPRPSLSSQWLKKKPAHIDAGLQEAAQQVSSGLIAQQLPNGTWPQTHSLRAHLSMQYALLQELRAEALTGLAKHKNPALRKAIALASAYAASQTADTPHEHALALLVVAACAMAQAQSAEHTASKDALVAWRHAMAKPIKQALFDQSLSLDPSQNPLRGSAQEQEMASPQALTALQWLALQTHRASCADPPNNSSKGETWLDWPTAMPRAWLQCLVQLFETSHHDAPQWLAIALLEAQQLHESVPLNSSNHLLSRRRLLEQLDALHQRCIWPEQSMYLPPHQPMQAFWQLERPFFAPVSSSASEQSHLLNQAAACVGLLQWLALSQSQTRAETSTVQPSHEHSPMCWDSQHLAALTAGEWRLPDGMQAPANITGLAATRQTHGPGAAVLLRHSGDTLGVHPAMAAALQASALIQAGSSQLSPGNMLALPTQPVLHIPILQIPDLAKALTRLAVHARQRIQAKVIAITGCVGKTSTARMLAQCLFGSSSACQDALLQQDTCLQMINWSDSVPWVLVELPLDKAAEHLGMLAPDMLVVTNLPPAPEGEAAEPSQDYAQQQIRMLMSTMRQDTVLVFEHGMASSAALQPMATQRGMALISFGTHAAATVHQHQCDDDGLLHIKLPAHARHAGANAADILHIPLQGHGRHMALNAQAAVAVLHALHCPLERSAQALSRWSPLPGAGQAEHLPHNIVLLDHSNTQELLATQAAFGHLLDHAPQAMQRLVVLGGVKPADAVSLSAAAAHSLHSAQLQIEPLLRSTATRRVLLYGQAMVGLAQQLKDQSQVSWYEDLNQLIQSLLQCLQPHDTVLLVGRAIVNLSIVASALREINDDTLK